MSNAQGDSSPPDDPVDTKLPGHRRAQRTESRTSTVSPRHASGRTEHVFYLSDVQKGGCATLRLMSNARSPVQLPVYFEGQRITGSVDFHFKVPTSIQTIRISVMGEIIRAGEARPASKFLELTQKLWPNSTITQIDNILGDFSLPFAIPIPTSVSLSGRTGLYRLPQSFKDQLTRASVQYQLSVRFKCGLERQHLQTLFNYVPCIKPDPPSPLRQLSYENRSPLLGPEADPEGWKTIFVTFNGDISTWMRPRQRFPLSVQFSLAKPLCYTRNTTIPLSLLVECENKRALDAVAKPDAILAHLRRCVRYTDQAPAVTSTTEVQDSTHRVEFVETAVWWHPESDAAPGPNQRRLEGEIHLPIGLCPSSDLGDFSISYAVILYPFTTIRSFRLKATEALLAEPIEIATVRADGPPVQVYSHHSHKPTRMIEDEVIDRWG